MKKKLILMDLDGTIIDHSINDIRESTKKAVQLLKEAGHTVAIATGRPPCLFYGVDKTLDIDTYIAGNGRFVYHKGETLYADFIDRNVIESFLNDMESKKIDVAFESVDTYAMNEKNDDLVNKFSEYFHLEEPILIPDFHKNNDILQMVMFYEGKDLSELKERYPSLDFNTACPYGVDINAKGGMKEIGLKILAEKLGFELEDTVAIGDGYNDVSMIETAGLGIAMGNGCEPLKKAADLVTDRCENDGLYKAFETLKMI